MTDKVGNLPGTTWARAGWPIKAQKPVAGTWDTLVCKGYYYFPRSDINPEARDYFKESDVTFDDPEVGTARFYDIVSDSFNYPCAAWYFPSPKPGYEKLKDRVAFRPTGIDDIRGNGNVGEGLHIGNDPFA